MPSPGTALRAARQLGPGPLLLYAQHALALQSGAYRRSAPLYRWPDRPLASWLSPEASPLETRGPLQAGGPRFLFDPGSDLRSGLRTAMGADGVDALIRQAEAILEGHISLFGGPPVALGFPPRWDTFAPLNGGANAPRLDLGRHWSDYRPEAMPADVKLLWEPSRFGWAYILARAYGVGGDTRYAGAFVEAVESWRAANPPNRGPHWTSAQEVAVRLMALTFCLAAFAPALADGQVEMIVQTLAAHAGRIPLTLAYARAQGNNHLLTEAAALYTMGLLFPALRAAPRWRFLGRRWLIDGLERQIFSDGGYVQHSANYQRLALHAGLWAARLAEVNGEPLPPSTLEALRRSAACLAALVDPDTGRAPNFGPNDGALILPITGCGFQDYRPVIRLASAMLDGSPALPAGPWDEGLVWFGLGAPRAGGRGVSTQLREDYPQAGLHFLRGGRSRGVLRCARFTSRPGHSDQLNFDLWWEGENLALDAGSYLYNAPEPWDNALAAARAHNAPMLDGCEPMRRAGRFLWLDWAQGRLLGRWGRPGEAIEAVAAAHDGYRKLGVEIMRTVARAGEAAWLVADEIVGEGVHRAALAWLLPGVPWEFEAPVLELDMGAGPLTLRLEAPGARVGLYRAGERVAGETPSDEAPVWGWRSPGYALREPALTLVAEVEGNLPLRLLTWWGLGAPSPDSRLEAEWSTPGPGRPGLRRLRCGEQRLEL